MAWIQGDQAVVAFELHWAWSNYMWDMDMAAQSKEHLAAMAIAKEFVIAAVVRDCHCQHLAHH